MTGNRPHALYIAWGFPPSRGSGVYRALATANGLVAAGFDVTVLTCDRETFYRYTMADPTLEDRVDPSIDVVRVPFHWPAQDIDIRRWDRRRARDVKAWQEWRVEEDQRDFPERGYGPWRTPLLEAARALHRRRPVDLTIATANPNVDVEVAHQLFLSDGVPFVLDQRDSWSLDIWEATENPDERVIALEAAYVRDAREVWFVNEPLRDVHAERYPASAEKIHSVSNGYDAPLAPAPRFTAPDPAAPLTFGYVGTLTGKLPIVEFCEGWVRARSRSADVATARADFWGHLGFFATRSLSLARPLEAHAGDGVAYRGPVEKAGVPEVFAGTDVLLLVLGAGKFVTSGKVYEYMASALPIVSVHEPDIDAARVLAGYPLWFPAASLDPDAIAEALVAAAAAARSTSAEVRQAAFVHAQAYERERQLAPRLAALHASVAGQEVRP